MSNYESYCQLLWVKFFKRFATLLDPDVIRSYILDMEDGILPPELEDSRSIEPYDTKSSRAIMDLNGSRDYANS